MLAVLLLRPHFSFNCVLFQMGMMPNRMGGHMGPMGPGQMMPNQMGGPPMGSRAPPPMYSPHMNQGGSPAMQGMMAQSPAGGQYVQSPASQVHFFKNFVRTFTSF